MTHMRNFPGRAQGQIARAILTRFSSALTGRGFARVRKTRRWERDGKHFREVIWVHKFSFGPDFRIHWDFVVPDPDGEDIIIGSSSDEYRGPKYRYHMSYHRAEQFQDRCYTDMVRFVDDIVLPWFAEWAAPAKASQAPGELRKLMKKETWNRVAELLKHQS